MNPKYISFNIEKEKGFRGHKFTATAFIDDKGHQLTEEPKEGSDIITITAQQRIYNSNGTLTEELAKALIRALEDGARNYKPIYEV